MTYRVRLNRILFSMHDDFIRIGKAERIERMGRTSFLLILSAMLIYMLLAYLGIGTQPISGSVTALTSMEYETSKVAFLIGRGLFGILFACIILFVPSFLFYLLTGISYKKLVIMQQAVLAVLLFERLLWIPITIFAGLSWEVSPLSFGIIASYLTDIPWVIYFFGAITLFQLWVIWFQTKFLYTFSDTRPWVVMVNVVLLSLLGWCCVAGLAYADTFLLSGWFE